MRRDVAVIALSIVATFAFFLVVKKAYGQEEWVNVGGPSYHFDRSKPHNEKNFGLGVRERLSDSWSVAGGVYKNSDYNVTAYLAFPYLPARTEYVAAGFTFGILAGGYSVKWAPYALPTLRFQWGRAGANLLYVPKVGFSEQVLWLNLEWRFR